MEIRIIINDGSPWRSKRYRATAEEIQRNRNEAAAQQERDERAREKAYPNSNTNANRDSSIHNS